MGLSRFWLCKGLEANKADLSASPHGALLSVKKGRSRPRVCKNRYLKLKSALLSEIQDLSAGQ
jgi:hypothetical protein